MLQLIGYDVTDLGGAHDALAKANEALAGSPDLCHNVPGGPWLVKTGKSVEHSLIKIDEAVAAAHKGVKPVPTRNLLALSLAQDGEELLGACRGFKKTEKWLAGKHIGFPLEDEGWFTPRVLAISFVLHGAESRDYPKLHHAILHRFEGCCNPLHTLWFVHTSLPPKEVCRYLEPYLPGGGKYELLVVQVRGPAVESGLKRVRTDVGWLWENGIQVRHRRPPEPVAHG